MQTRVYIGNLAWKTSNDSLRGAFSSFGNVVDAKVMTERDSGRSRGFGFVTFSSEQEADAAVGNMNGQELDGRTIKVAIASERERQDRGGFSAERNGFAPERGGFATEQRRY
jgi:RNA recognition motif-containing protein